MLLTVLLGGFWVGWVTFAKLVYHVAGDGTWLWTKRLLLWSLGMGRTAFGGCYTLARPLEGFVQLHPSLWYNIHTVISHRTLSRDQHATTRQLRTTQRRPPSMGYSCALERILHAPQQQRLLLEPVEFHPCPGRWQRTY